MRLDRLIMVLLEALNRHGAKLHSYSVFHSYKDSPAGGIGISTKPGDGLRIASLLDKVIVKENIVIVDVPIFVRERTHGQG